jgi:hypothetical protein
MAMLRSLRMQATITTFGVSTAVLVGGAQAWKQAALGVLGEYTTYFSKLNLCWTKSASPV